VGSGFHSLREYRGIESIIHRSYLPLAWRGERDGEGIFGAPFRPNYRGRTRMVLKSV
jgi:hypothetical protein